MLVEASTGHKHGVLLRRIGGVGWRWRLAALATTLGVVMGAVVLYGWIRTPGVLSDLRAKSALHLQQHNLREDSLAALLLVEDPGFYRYLGEEAVAGGGVSRITRRVVESLFFDSYHPGPLGINALLRNVISVGFNWRVDKPRQFLYYINFVGLGQQDGRRVRGFEDAAQSYFNKRFIQLDDEEFLRLAAMLADPERYHVIEKPKANTNRLRRIQRYTNGDCRPAGTNDVELTGCK